MPASSRKRNKGKDRKAKKAAEKEEAAMVELQKTWHGWARGNMGPWGGMEILDIPCKHGFSDVVRYPTNLILFQNLLIICVCVYGNLMLC
jgi:hypothetical protein